MGKNKMKATVIEKYGQELPEIKEVDIPSSKEKEVLIKIKAVSINPIDIKTMEGKLKILLSYNMSLISGSDASGIITETGQ